ncbi:hypothetical protein [Streptomyces sp. NBC_01207]|uniref:hypothetical protein n=1 Tax=Streptomyces sp. NBC_01207 TaxID=2903772 RepID=UPI002E146E6A|nr:hypothetical protein OG457_05210 [Streptomyces sp. NBC_01207]
MRDPSRTGSCGAGNHRASRFIGTDLSPMELLYKVFFVVITVSAVRESWSRITFRRTRTDLPADA